MFCVREKEREIKKSGGELTSVFALMGVEVDEISLCVLRFSESGRFDFDGVVDRLALKLAVGCEVRKGEI